MLAPLPIQAIAIVRFHATRGQEIVSIYPSQSHGLSEQQLMDVRMLAMQEGIEPSPNQKNRFVFKIRSKTNEGDRNGSSSSSTPPEDMYGYSCFKRCRDAEGSARGFFHQSIVLITHVHKRVGLCSAAGCAYRELFFSVVSRLDDIIADLPALEEAVTTLYGEEKRDAAVGAGRSAGNSRGGGGKWDDGDADVDKRTPFGGSSSSSSSSSSSAGTSETLSPTAHSWGELHQTLEVAWMHFKQWLADGLGQRGVMQALPFYGEIIEFLLPAEEKWFNGASLPVTEVRSTAVLALARLGLLPHVWTLWELLLRGKDIVVYSPSAAVTSSVVLVLVELLLPKDSGSCSGYDVRPYIGSCDSDVYGSLTMAREDPCRAPTTTSSSSGAGAGAGAAPAGGAKKRPQPARLVGISNPFLLRAFERYDCALLLPNPDIGYATSSVFVGREKSSANEAAAAAVTAAAAGGSATISDSGSSKGVPAKRFSFSQAAAGLSSLFSGAAATVATTAYADAKVAFTPLGVGYMCSQLYMQDLRDAPDQCYDVNEEGRKVYRPVLGPFSGNFGTPYAGVAAIPTLLKVLEAKSSVRSPPEFEAAYDEWAARNANKMPLSEKGDVRGTNGVMHNHSRHSLTGGGSSSTKCHGLLVVRAQTGKMKNAAVSILPESEVQTQLNAAVCGGDNSAGSAVAIADVLLREHIFQLNSAVLAPFEMLRSRVDVHCTEGRKALPNPNPDKDVGDLLRFYGLESSSPSDSDSEAGSVEKSDLGSGRWDETGDTEDSSQVDHSDLLIGAIAAFQRQSMPTSQQQQEPAEDISSWGRHWDTNEAIYVPVCIRKIFFDYGGAAGGSAGAVCSPFLLDVSQTRFIYQWLRTSTKNCENGE